MVFKGVLRGVQGGLRDFFARDPPPVMRQRASGNGIGIVGVWAGSPLSSWAPVNLSSSQNLLGRTVSTPTAALRAQTIVTFHRGLPTQGQQPLYTGGES